MRKLSTIVTNRDSASTGFSDGKLRDNPGNDTGSGVMAGYGNDVWYALRAIVKKWSGTGDVSDSPESENNHDVLDAIEQMMGLSVYGVADYNPATTYSTAGESVMYAGIQFVNILPSLNPVDAESRLVTIVDNFLIYFSFYGYSGVIGDGSAVDCPTIESGFSVT